MVMNPLGPLIEKTSELTNIGADMLTAAQEVGGSALKAAFEKTSEAAVSVTETGRQAVDSVVHLGSTALDTTVDATKTGLRIPGAVLGKVGDVGGDLVEFGAGLLPALGDRVGNKQKPKK